LALSWPLAAADEDEDEGGRSVGRLTPGGNVKPFASYIWTVRRPGLRVESDVGFVFEVDVVEDEDFSTEDDPG